MRRNALIALVAACLLATATPARADSESGDTYVGVRGRGKWSFVSLFFAKVDQKTMRVIYIAAGSVIGLLALRAGVQTYRRWREPTVRLRQPWDNAG